MSTETVTDPTVRSRSSALDGIRGIAIALVVLSHSWTLWEFAPLRHAAPLDGLFYAGNESVTVFLVIGGFLVTRSLLNRSADGRLRLGWYVIERIVRVGTQLYLVLIAVLVVHELHQDPYSLDDTVRSVLAAATHTWNWYLINHPFNARPDIGALWYLSVSEQFYLALAVLFTLAPRMDRRRLAWWVAGLIIAVTVWRYHVLHHEYVFRASLRTTTRMDGLLYGMLVALLLDRAAHALRPHAARLTSGGLLLLGAVVLSTGRWGDDSYYSWLGVLTCIGAAAFVLGVALGPAGGAPVGSPVSVRARRVVEWPPFVRLGRASLAIYVWHYPVFWLVARKTPTWDWFPKAVLAFSIVSVIVLVTRPLVDEPTTRLVAAIARRQRRPVRRHAQVSESAVGAAG
jgi:peptidoglycan/LPS O-acetylase OafA/YrhL